MTLVFDQNLSSRLVTRLGDVYPGITHVELVGLERVTDIEVWEYARSRSLTIVSKDADFADLSVLLGAPPKVVWLRLGNCTTTDVENALRRARETLDAFIDDPTSRVLEII